MLNEVVVSDNMYLLAILVYPFHFDGSSRVGNSPFCILRGRQSKFLNESIAFLSLKIVSILATSADPDEILHAISRLKRLTNQSGNPKDRGSIPGEYYMVSFVIFEPQHEISNNVVCETSKDSDQPARTHDHSL